MNHEQFQKVYPQDMKDADTGKHLRRGGQTLLDSFAMRALPVILQAHINKGMDRIDPTSIGFICYKIALGMMVAREAPDEAYMEQKPVEPPAEEKSPIILPSDPKAFTTP